VGSEHLHVHSETEAHNLGPVFSSQAPGILMGVGNVGDHQKPYEECDLYVSMDAGLTWKKALDGPHKYEFGDQGGIIVAVPDHDKADRLWYSFNYGSDWKEFSLGDGVQVKPIFLTTIPDSTGEKFTMLGRKEEGGFTVLSLNFEGSRGRKCNLNKKGNGGDFEKWYARYDEEGIISICPY
jgi:Sortilin, neurotensin receptor 3,/Sortilin, neurotensin receptor 3, C-terminal